MLGESSTYTILPSGTGFVTPPLTFLCRPSQIATFSIAHHVTSNLVRSGEAGLADDQNQYSGLET
jgi:hypothetical protein